MVSTEGHLALNSQLVSPSTPCVPSTLTVPLTQSKEPIKMSLSVSSVLALPLSVIAQAPNPPPQAPPGLQPAADTFISWMKWGGLVGGVIGMIICGLMMILGRRNRSATAVDGATGIPWILGGLTVISLSAGLVGALLG